MSGFIFNEHALRALLTDRDGPVARDLARRAINVESQAKLNASGRPGPNVDTGRLRSSITYEIVERAEGTLVARIGTNVEYARFVEEGGDPPGSRGPGYPYLKPALEAARL